MRLDGGGLVYLVIWGVSGGGMTVAMDSPSNVNALVEVKAVCWCSVVPVGGRMMVLVYEAGGSVDLGLNLRLSFKDERGR